MVLADLENDYMKGDTNYPLDMPSAYRFLDEFKLDKSGRDSQTKGTLNQNDIHVGYLATQNVIVQCVISKP